jgi:hypothetical protein
MSATHKNTVHPLLEGSEHMVRRDASRAHHPDNTNICRVLHTTDPSQVSSGICSPGAQKAYDIGFKILITHHNCPYIYILKKFILLTISNFPVPRVLGSRLPRSGPAAVQAYILQAKQNGRDRWQHNCRSPCTKSH